MADDDASSNYPISALRAQWAQPSDVMSVLMILGGEVIQKALAQLAGSPITPVAFSFGWVTYAISALLSTVGDNKLLPLPDAPCAVINSRSRYGRENCSWILGRIMRDFKYWQPPQVAEEKQRFLFTASNADPSRQPRVALCISVFDADKRRTAGVARKDWLWYSGILCAIVQLGVAAIPCGLYKDWSILMTTAAGILFSFASGALPQWSTEKWCCRRNSRKTVALTPGNGSEDCIIVFGNEVGLDLEDLAGGRAVDIPDTRWWTSIMAVLWTALLICVSGLGENTWFLLAVGLLGMIQNIIVCGAPRDPSAFGVHLELREVFLGHKVMRVLMDIEERYPRLGRCLVETYFPGGILRPDEEEYWQRADDIAREKEAAEKAGKNA